MQTSFIPPVANPTTTIRRYSLVVEADKRRQAALTKWKAAAEAMLECSNSFTEARLIEAAAEFKQANADYYSVTKTAFPKPAA